MAGIASRLSDPRLTRWLVAGLLAGGALVRLAWLIVGHRAMAPLGNESEKIAAALVAGRGFADAFAVNSGPTAHLAPLTPLLTAAAYAGFGSGTPAAHWALALVSLAITLTGFWLAWRAFALLDSPHAGRLFALAIVALLPLQFGLEMREFQSWEAGLAATLMAAMLLWVLRLDGRATIAPATLVALGLANGAVALISPAAGFATSGMVGILLLRRVPMPRWILPVAASAIVVAALVAPWAVRNERALGAPVLLRTGIGISLAIVYNDKVLTADRETTYYHGLLSLHPNANAAALAEYRRVGEIAYNRRLQDDARRWIAAHPDAALRIRLQNLRDYYFPPEWHFNRFGTKGRGAAMRAVAVGLASAAGFLTLAVMLWRRRWRYLYPAAAVVLPCLPYIYSYPLLRYRYLVSTLLVFLACDGGARLVRAITSRRHAPGDSSTR